MKKITSVLWLSVNITKILGETVDVGGNQIGWGRNWGGGWCIHKPVMGIHLISYNSWTISLEQLGTSITDYSDVYHNSQKG